MGACGSVRCNDESCGAGFGCFCEAPNPGNKDSCDRCDIHESWAENATPNCTALYMFIVMAVLYGLYLTGLFGFLIKLVRKHLAGDLALKEETHFWLYTLHGIPATALFGIITHHAMNKPTYEENVAFYNLIYAVWLPMTFIILEAFISIVYCCMLRGCLRRPEPNSSLNAGEPGVIIGQPIHSTQKSAEQTLV
eukprot:Hpha_TRINITY_DN177_c0_g2::TRINITY_DN177_c0_g2_i1::g.82445::m.82445